MDEAPHSPGGFPFWGYRDLALFIGVAFPAILVGAVLVKSVTLLLHLTFRSRALELVPAQFVGYGLLFLALASLFKLQYGRPFWKSLGWVSSPIGAGKAILLGTLLAFAIELVAVFLKTPDTDNPMKELLADRTSLVLIAIFATTLGPLCEELIFRGFMQPLFIRSLGVLPGILLAALPFGLLHLEQYGFSWRHALLITIAGVGFGWMRYSSGSTRAATLMHAAYNFVFFLGLVAQGQGLPGTL